MLHRNFKFIEQDTFEVGYNPQKEWAWLITTAFFLGEVGAGLFLVSLFLPEKINFWSALAGWLIVAIGKNTAHFIYLGKPWRFWRMIFRPQTSWISRGFYATTLMCVLGLPCSVSVSGHTEHVNQRNHGARRIFRVRGDDL